MWGQGPLPRAPSAPPRGPLPLDDSPRGGGRATAPQVGGGGRMPYWAPAPLLARRARLAGPRRTRGSTPGSRGRVHHTATARTPLPRRGGAPTIRGRHRWRGPGQHPGPTLGSPPASRPGPPATLVRARMFLLQRFGRYKVQSFSTCHRLRNPRVPRGQDVSPGDSTWGPLEQGKYKYTRSHSDLHLLYRSLC